MKANKDYNSRENILFMTEDDYAQETAIYLELDSKKFKHENNLILAEIELRDSINQFFWEENDVFEN
tara:strand:- start:134933 stop:135133 length:201 start_codon:yes stop_codon:yes gene_type:complete